MSHSLREIFWDVAGQLSDSLKCFVGQKRKMPNKNNRVLLCSNTGLFIFSKHCEFDGFDGKNARNFQSSSIEDQVSQKHCVGNFQD